MPLQAGGTLAVALATTCPTSEWAAAWDAAAACFQLSHRGHPTKTATRASLAAAVPSCDTLPANKYCKQCSADNEDLICVADGGASCTANIQARR